MKKIQDWNLETVTTSSVWRISHFDLWDLSTHFWSSVALLLLEIAQCIAIPSLSCLDTIPVDSKLIRSSLKQGMKPVAVLSSMLLCCSSYTGVWHAKIMQYNQAAVEDRSYAGRSILLFPLIVEGKFDTGTALSSQEQSRIIQTIRRGVEVVLKEEFEEGYLQKHTQASLDSFYTDLLTNTLLSLTTRYTVWRCIPGC